MGKKQTYAKVMKDLTAKKAKYEAGLAEARRLNSASGINDYERRLTKLNAGMDELFQAQEASKAAKMAKGGSTGMPKYELGGPTTTRGGWTTYTVPNDGSYPGAFVNSRGEYVMLANKDGRVLPLNNEMAQHLDGDNPRHLFYKLDQGDYDNYINSYQSVDNPDFNPNMSTYGDIGQTTMPPTSSEMPEESVMPEDTWSPGVPTFAQLPADPTDGGQVGVNYGMPNNLGTTGVPQTRNLAAEQAAADAAVANSYTGFANQGMPMNTGTDLTGVQTGAPGFHVQPASTTTSAAAATATPDPLNPLAPISPLREMELQSLHNKINARSVGAMEAPTWSVADLNPDAKAQGFRSKVEDAAMNIGGVGQNLKSKWDGMDASTKQGIGMALGAAAQFLPDIAAMRAMDRIEAPEDAPYMRLQTMNPDVQVGASLAAVDNASRNAIASVDRNISNPAVAAAMKRANQRVASGQKANILNREAEMESQMRERNMVLANENMNQNRMIDYQNRQRQADFRNEKLAAKNRMRQQMGMKLGQVFGDFQNMHQDKMRWDILSKGFDPSLLNRNQLDWNSMFGTTNSND